MATIKDVSKLAGVSKATVSRVINGNQSVSPESRDRVMQAMDELGYKPNALAQALATNRSKTIGMVVSDLSGAFFGPMMKSAEKVIREAGWQLVVTNSQGQENYEREAIDFLFNRPVDAMIVTLYAFPETELLQMNRQGTPVVVVNREVQDFTENCIYLDNVYGGYLATKHLLEKGHRNIAHLCGHLTHSDAQERLSGYKKALAEFGISYDSSLVYEEDYNEAGGHRACRQLLESGAEFTAIFCGNDGIAIGANQELNLHGKSVPEDVSLVGYDDVNFARYLTPALTTIHFPVEEMGAQAAELALKQITNSDTEIKHRLVPQLIERDSVKQLAK